MFNKYYTPDYIPKLSDDATDTSQFDALFTNEEIFESIVPPRQ